MRVGWFFAIHRHLQPVGEEADAEPAPQQAPDAVRREDALGRLSEGG